MMQMDVSFLTDQIDMLIRAFDWLSDDSSSRTDGLELIEAIQSSKNGYIIFGGNLTIFGKELGALADTTWSVKLADKLVSEIRRYQRDAKMFGRDELPIGDLLDKVEDYASVYRISDFESEGMLLEQVFSDIVW